jgi:hypothetical protein
MRKTLNIKWHMCHDLRLAREVWFVVVSALTLKIGSDSIVVFGKLRPE